MSDWREIGRALRAGALALDAAPHDTEAIAADEALRAVAELDPIMLSGKDSAAALIELARGDAGMVLAAPGPALAGRVLAQLGDDEQRERLRAAVAGGRTWAYLAITEPDVGSDATRLRTELRRDTDGRYRLYGTKRYIGNGHRGTVGVVLARTGPSPLALRAVLLDTARARTRPLDMLGLRGAQISELEFDGVPVEERDLLGSHLSPLRRGMWSIAQVFTAVRVQVAALAVGTAFAIHDLVADHHPGGPTLDDAHAHVRAAEALVLRAAAESDHDRESAAPAASLAKLTATGVALDVARTLPRLLGPAALVTHPLLEKWCRDVRAFEFMEGTSQIQRLHAAQGIVRGSVWHAT